jgi:peroxiredoxin
VRSRWARRLAEVLLVVVIVGGIYAWRTRDLLPAGERVAPPAFELLDLQGRRWTPETLAGKPAVLYFFAPWCGVCAASSPQLRWFDRWMGEEVQVVMVGLDWANLEELADYAARHELRLPILAAGAEVAADYRVGGYPTYYVLDAEGRIAARDFGYTTAPGLWLRTRGL